MSARMSLKMEARSREAFNESTFSLSCWEWEPLHALLVNYCSSLIDEDMLRQLADLGGEGPLLQNSCDLIADSLELAINTIEPERYGKDTIDIFAFSSQDLRVNEEGNQLTPVELSDPREFSKSITPYRISKGRIEEFIEFLRHCGGFKVS